MTSLYARLLGAALCVAALVGLYGYAHHQGAASVQAQWEAAKGAQAIVDATASEAARGIEHNQAADFAGIDTTYLRTTAHAYPSLADALPAAAAAGAVRLRHACPEAVAGGGLPDAPAGARTAAAAAAAAATQRLADAVAAVRVGDAADARERQLGAQVIALQALLAAERATAKH